MTSRRARFSLGALALLLAACSSGGSQSSAAGDVDLHEEEHRHRCPNVDVPFADKTPPPLIQGPTYGLAVDDEGNRFVAGEFCDARDFDPGGGTENHIAPNSSDACITRFNPDSHHVWTVTFGGSNADGARNVLVLGNTVYVIGDFSSTDAGFGGRGRIASHGDQDVFVLALNATTGVPLMDFGDGGVVTFGGAGHDVAEGIGATKGGLYVTGYFDSLDAGIGGLGGARSLGKFDGFVLALERNSGQPLAGFGAGGVQTMGGSRSDQALDLAVGGDTVYVAGAFWSSDFGIGGAGSLRSQLYDAFVVALDRQTGQPRTSFGTGGVQTFGGRDQDVAEAILVAGPTLYVGGRFGSNDAGVGGKGSFAPATDAHDAFVLALDPDTGAVQESFGAGGLTLFGGFGIPAETFDFEGVTCLAAAGSTLYAGGFLRSKDAGVNGAGTLGSRGFSDAFVWAMSAASGNPVVDFATGGVQTFGGGDDDFAQGVAAFGTQVYLAGNVTSRDAFATDCGPFDAQHWGGYLLTLDVADGAPVCADGYP